MSHDVGQGVRLADICDCMAASSGGLICREGEGEG